MRVNKYYIRGLLAVICIIILFSCSKMDDTYADFLKDGEIIYTGKVDSIKTYPGSNRLGLSMLLISDPRISKVKVFWNTGSHPDSIEKNIQRSPGVDTVRFYFDQLPEGTFTFYIYTYDNLGHRSIKTDVIADVYGEKYIAQLVNRAIKTTAYSDANKSVQIKWFGVGPDVIGEQIVYTDDLGSEVNMVVPADSITVLPAWKKGNAFQFRTLYKPTLNAIDTFYSNYETRLVQ